MIIVLNIIGQLLQAIGILAILAATYTYVVYRRQLSFDVITKCADRFRVVMEGIEAPDPFERRKAQRQYVDLCNEQLFYCGAGYLPEAVVDEWLDGMIDYLPQLRGYKGSVDEGDSPMVRDVCAHDESSQKKKAVDPDLLIEYPRIALAFCVGEKPFNLDEPRQRRNLIDKVKSDLEREEGLLASLEDRLKDIGQSINTIFQRRDRRVRGGE